MKIGTREVGPGHSTFVVAEIGSNHGGSLDAALALIDAAADAGADAVKFQLWNPDKMYDPKQFPDEHASAVKWQLPRWWLPLLMDRAHSRGMAFGCSAFDFDSLDFVDPLVDFHKIASIEAEWTAFLAKVIGKRKPTLVSNGMSRNRSRAAAIEWAISLHCTVAYPANLDDVNLRARPFSYEEYGEKHKLWGLSDHTTHPTIAPCAAVALGACVIEKHIRLGLVGDVPQEILTEMTPDWPHSIAPADFEYMVSAIRLTERVLGSSEKRIRPSEEPYLKYRRGPKGLRGS